MDTLEKSELLQLITRSAEFNRMEPGIHGKDHACRVYFIASALANLLSDHRSLDHAAIMIASLLHDCGRTDDSFNTIHGKDSARLAWNFIEKNKIPCSKELVFECIIHHCPPDGYKNLKPATEAKIVADADKLDRFRFRNNPNPVHEPLLELEESKALMKLAAMLNDHPFGRDQ